jgi:hypothetical protein
VLTHLDSQIARYDESAIHSMTWHFRLRTLQILTAAVIPVTQVFVSGVAARITAGALAAFVAILQGIDSLHHYGDHYANWRATAQQLWRERFLFAAPAGPYKGFPAHGSEALATLADRVDAIEAQENRQWHSAVVKDESAALEASRTK